MNKKVKAIPEGYHAVTPYLSVRNAANALDFYKKALNATELMRYADERTGKVMHAEIKIGDSIIMLAEEAPDMNFLSPLSVGNSSVVLHLYVENVDTLFQQAINAGAKTQRAVADQFYGDRSGCLTDPFGHVWNISTHVKDVSMEDMHNHCSKDHCC